MGRKQNTFPRPVDVELSKLGRTVEEEETDAEDASLSQRTKRKRRGATVFGVHDPPSPRPAHPLTRPPLGPLLRPHKPAPTRALIGGLISHTTCVACRDEQVLLPHHTSPTSYLLERFLDRVLRGFPGSAPPSGLKLVGFPGQSHVVDRPPALLVRHLRQTCFGGNLGI